MLPGFGLEVLREPRVATEAYFDYVETIGFLEDLLPHRAGALLVGEGEEEDVGSVALSFL